MKSLIDFLRWASLSSRKWFIWKLKWKRRILKKVKKFSKNVAKKIGCATISRKKDSQYTFSQIRKNFWEKTQPKNLAKSSFDFPNVSFTRFKSCS